jgi:formamidopyrimidine-DNA glycosylase
MPELPEVETVRRFLQNHLLGQTIGSLEVLNPKSFDGNLSDVVGQKFTQFSRRGKQLSAHLGNNLILLFHLKMTGQIILVPPTGHFSAFGHPTSDMYVQVLPNKSTRIIFHLSSGSTLYFNDQRKFGWVKVFTPDSLAQFQHGLGVDILDPEFTLDYFSSQLRSTSRPIKLVLLDQTKFAGIGNIYANDALFLAKIHPLTPASQIRPNLALNLWQSVSSVINQGITHGGSTTKDKKYLRPDGSTGSHQYHFQVYQRAGEPCSICGRPIQRLVLGGRGTFFCSHCQPLKD